MLLVTKKEFISMPPASPWFWRLEDNIFFSKMVLTASLGKFPKCRFEFLLHIDTL